MAEHGVHPAVTDPRPLDPARVPGGVDDPPSIVVLACGALARELLALLSPVPGITVTCLPASLHNRPERIPGAVLAGIERIRGEHGPDVQVLVGYADCGTGGLLDTALEGTGIERLPGAHCYEVYAGSAAFEALTDDDPATFFLTDFLARQFETLVWRGLKLDRHPQLLPMLFGNYRRLVYLAQADDPELDARARDAAGRLGLAYERRRTGIGELGAALAAAGVDPVTLTAGGGGPAAGADGPGDPAAVDRAPERAG